MSPMRRYRRVMGKDFSWTWGKVLWLVLIPLLVFMLTGQIQRVQDGRGSCDRGNVIRAGTVEGNNLTGEFVRTARTARADSALQEMNIGQVAQARIDFQAARQYHRIAVDFDALNMELLESVAPVAVAPGSYEADCKKAWPTLATQPSEPLSKCYAR